MATTTQIEGSASATLTACSADNVCERRENARTAVELNACLVPLSGAAAIRCRTDNVAEGGMHVTVPVGYGVAVGQRYELLLAAPGASVGMGPLVTNAGSYATVVRTRLYIDPAGDRVGVGMRFDQPIAAAGRR